MVETKSENIKVAIVYEWFFRMAGGERVIDALCELYPNADIFALFGEKKELLENIQGHNMTFSFLQRIPMIKNFYRYTYFLWPSAIESLKLDNYDLVISVSHCVAKGVIVPEGTLHLSYIFTPMRYAWDMSCEYFNQKHFSTIKRNAIQLFLPYLRFWDYYSSKRAGKIAVISSFSGDRVNKYYKLDYDRVIHPPVDVEKAVYNEKVSDYYLAIAPFEPNKYGDIIVDAAKHFGFKLKLIGDGSTRKRLEKSARGFSNIELLGYVSEEKKFNLLSRAIALINMGTEDFGIASVEAQACGIPVIGFDAGGIKETVIADRTGILIDSRTKESLGKAIEDLELKLSINYFDRQDIIKHSKKFSKERFLIEMKGWIDEQL